MKKLFESPWFVAALLIAALLWASRVAPADAELSAAAGSAAEDAAYRLGLTDGAREARLRCGKPLTTTPEQE